MVTVPGDSGNIYFMSSSKPPLMGPVIPAFGAYRTNLALIGSYIQTLYNKWNYEMIMYYYMDWFVLIHVFSLPAHIFPECCNLHTLKIYQAQTDTSGLAVPPPMSNYVYLKGNN